MFEVVEVITSPKVIDSLKKKRYLSWEIENAKGSFINLKSESSTQSVLAILERDCLRYIDTKDISFQGWTPRDREQNCYFWSLRNKKATFCLGAAGTGKTSIALSYGINNLFRNSKPLILCKPTIFIGNKSNAIAAVPGNEKDKLAPYLDSYMPGLKKILGKSYKEYIYDWEEQELLQLRAIELMRGQHFEDCTLILDEAQNLSLHELVSVLSRVDDQSQVIILGDPGQIDAEHSWPSSGLGRLLSSPVVRGSNLTACISLHKQYRSGLASLMQDALQDLEN